MNLGCINQNQNHTPIANGLEKKKKSKKSSKKTTTIQTQQIDMKDHSSFGTRDERFQIFIPQTHDFRIITKISE